MCVTTVRMVLRPFVRWRLTGRSSWMNPRIIHRSEGDQTRRESVEEARGANRPDIVAATEAEIAVCRPIARCTEQQMN